MSNISFLALDSETKKLMDSFSKTHPDGGVFAFKLLLKFYLKFTGWHKKKGRNPISAFEELIEREILGQSKLTDFDRIKQLNELIERSEDVALADNGNSDSNMILELKGIKDLLQSISKARPPVMSSQVGHGKPAMSLEDYKPSDGAVLTKISEAKPKKRKSYRDVRKSGSAKKISF